MHRKSLFANFSLKKFVSGLRDLLNGLSGIVYVKKTGL